MKALKAFIGPLRDAAGRYDNENLTLTTQNFPTPMTIGLSIICYLRFSSWHQLAY